MNDAVEKMTDFYVLVFVVGFFAGSESREKI